MFCTSANVVQSISFKDVQPAVFSSDSCTGMKKEGAALLFWFTSWRPANQNILFGCKVFLVLLPRRLHAQLKPKHVEALNLLAIPDLLMMSDWAVPHQRHIITEADISERRWSAVKALSYSDTGELNSVFTFPMQPWCDLDETLSVLTSWYLEILCAGWWLLERVVKVLRGKLVIISNVLLHFPG